MRTVTSSVLAVLTLLLLAACNPASVKQEAIPETAVKKHEITRIPEVETLLAQMTLEEKVGQMTQVTSQAVSHTEGTVDSEQIFDEDSLRIAIVDYKVGSILNVWNRAMSPEKWQKEITRMQDLATKETRLGIPIIYGIDAIHGATYTEGATLFPQSINLAATRCRNAARIIGEVTAQEIRVAGIPWNFNPVLGLARQPLWPRFWETYGEDAYLNGELGVAYIQGLQGDDPSAPDRVAACAKHYLGYSVPRTGHDRTPAVISDRELRELFLEPFRKAVEAGVLTFMINSSEINGTPVHANRYLLTDVLKNELGFEGLIVTDWYDIINLYEREKIASSEREAVKIAVLAGNDMSMVPFDYSFHDHLTDLVRSGEVPMEVIDESVRRILNVKFKLGLFEDPYPQTQLMELFATEENRAKNRLFAAESMTLLKNEDSLLPLSKDTKLFITGPNADRMNVLNGGWTITWQGNEEALYPEDANTVAEAFRAVAGDRISYMQGISHDTDVNMEEALAAAAASDVILLTLGEDAYCESPGSIDDLDLPHIQYQYAARLAELGKPIVLVLIEGRPRIVRPVVPLSKAVIFAGLPGMEGGNALADVIYGDVNPTGALPFTYPRSSNDLKLYDHKHSEIMGTEEFNPQWQFGDGLQYTDYSFTDLTLNASEYRRGEEIKVSVKVSNTGDRLGKKAVELYLSDHYASITPPVKRLKRFSRIALKPGESRTVEFTLNHKDLQFVNARGQWICENGMFTVQIAGLSRDFELK